MSFLTTAWLQLRCGSCQGHGDFLKQVENLIADLGQQIPDFKASVKVANDRAPVETNPNEPVVQSFFDVVAEVAGERPVLKGVQYYTDAVAFVPMLKVPMIICGPGDTKLAR